MFIHKAVLEAAMSANTIITAPLANKLMAKLASKDPKSGKTGFQMQFEVCIDIPIFDN